MSKDSCSDGGSHPLSLLTPQQPHKAPPQPSPGSGANKGGCRPSHSAVPKGPQREMLQAKMQGELLRSREACRHLAEEAQELRLAAKRDRQLLADQLHSRWDQQRARELQRIREANRRDRDAEIRQLMRWKEAELRETRELLQQERDNTLRQARDLQRQVAKELTTRASSGRNNSRREGGAGRGGGGGGGRGGSGGGLSAESQAKLEGVLGKLQKEVNGDQAAQIRQLKAQLELERRLFLKYILEGFEAEPLPAGSPHRSREAPSPQHPGENRPHSSESLTAACTPEDTTASRSCSPDNSQSICEPSCHQPLAEEDGSNHSSSQDLPPKEEEEVAKDIDAENESNEEASVDLPAEGQVSSEGSTGQGAEEVLPKQGWVSAESYTQLMQQNTDLSNALMDLERMNARLVEENEQLKKRRFPGIVEWVKRKTAKLSASAKRLGKSSKKVHPLSLPKQCENLRHKAEEEKHKRCDETEEKYKTALKKNPKISKGNLQLQEKNKLAENENPHLKAILIQVTDERNSAVQLTEGLTGKTENSEEVMKEGAESQQQLQTEQEATLLELQKKDEERQRLQQAQKEMRRQYEEEVQLLEARVKELENQTEELKLLSQEHEQSRIKKPWILGSESSPATRSAIGRSRPEKWERDTFRALPCSDYTNDEDCASIVSLGLIQSPFKPCAFLE